MVWTDEAVEELKRMWDKGMTTGQIAKVLNVTKNSIIGKVHRLCLTARPSPIKKAETNDKEKNIVTLETDGNKLMIKSNSVEIGRVEEKMYVDKNNDENIKISFVAKYMMEALKSFPSDKVEISFVGEIKPIILKAIEDESLTQLVLPIRTY